MRVSPRSLSTARAASVSGVPIASTPSIAPICASSVRQSSKRNSVTLMCGHSTAECHTSSAAARFSGVSTSHTGVRNASFRRPAKAGSKMMVTEWGMVAEQPKSPAAALPLILLLEPVEERAEVVDDRGGVHLALAGQRLESFGPGAAHAHRQHLLEARAGFLVAVDRAAVQRA